MDGHGNDNGNGNGNKRRKLHSIWSDLGKELAKEQRCLDNDRRDLDARSQKFEAEKEATTKELLAEREKLEGEKEAMMKSGVTDRDVLELNVGGEMFAVQRGTLLLAPEDSHLHAMFSGRWEESLARSKEGAIFVDMSPHVFRIILSSLRDARLRAKPPTWSSLKASDPIYQNELESVIKFFGLVDPGPPFVMKATHGLIDVVDGLVLEKNGMQRVSPAISSENLTTGTVWKIHIKSLLGDDWMFAGIIAASPTVSSYTDPTSFGWAGGKQVWVGGKDKSDKYDWIGWQANDAAIFKLESRSLKMYHMRLERTFTLKLPTKFSWKMHLSMLCAGDKVEVSAPTNQEVSMLD